MTPNQMNLIERLTQEKQSQLVGLAAAPGADQAKAQYVLDLVAGRAAAPESFEKSSAIISWLLSLPRPARVTGQATEQGDAVEVQAGRYALVDPEMGIVKFFVVDRPTEGRWQGYTFLNALASDEKHPIRDRATKAAIMGRIAENPGRAMRLYAAELGRCAYCGRTLTDEVSRAAGIGPDCAQQHGEDRSVWAEQAEAEQAERLREVYEAAPEDGAAAVDAHERTQAEIDQAEEDYNRDFARQEQEAERAAYEAEMNSEAGV